MVRVALGTLLLLASCQPAMPGKADSCAGVVADNLCFVPTYNDFFFLTQAQARALCQQDGGILAELHTSAAETAVVTQLTFGRYWLGGIYDEEVGDFVWGSGITFPFVRWALGQPDGAMDAGNCVQIDGTSSEWFDEPCNSNTEGYVCMFKIDVPTDADANPVLETDGGEDTTSPAYGCAVAAGTPLAWWPLAITLVLALRRRF